MDMPLRLLVTLEFRTHQGDEYLAVKAALADMAWRVVDEVRLRNLYPAVYTFPGWDNPDQMRDFGFLHSFWPISGRSAMCVRISNSPIDDEIESDARCLVTESASERGRAVYPREACERCAALDCVRSLLSMPGLVRAMAAIVADEEPQPTVVRDADAAIGALWDALQDAVRNGSPDANLAVAVAFPES